MCPCQWRVSAIVVGQPKHRSHTSPNTLVHCPQVIDDGPLILTIFSAPWAVSKASEMLKGLGIMNSLQAHDLWGLLGGYHPYEF